MNNMQWAWRGTVVLSEKEKTNKNIQGNLLNLNEIARNYGPWSTKVSFIGTHGFHRDSTNLSFGILGKNFMRMVLVIFYHCSRL